MSRFAVVALAATALTAAPLGAGAVSPSRIVDRTLLCTMTGVGYPDPVRFLRVGAARHDPATVLPASISASNGGSTISVITGRDDEPLKSTLAWRGAPCKTTNVVVPLSRNGLAAGGVASYESYDCEVPARLVIRIRGIFEQPVRVSAGIARGSLVYGYLAVATPARQPVAFASLAGRTQQASVFVSPSRCKEDS